MSIAIAYPAAAALSPRQDAAAPAIRTVAAQVRRQIPREPDSLALTLPALIDACRAVEVNEQRLSVSWELGRALRDIANACIDISNGLLADLGHVCAGSGVGARVEIAALPSSDALRTTFEAERCRLLQAGGGDDYELCFTAPASAHEAVRKAASAAATAVSCIGRIEEGAGVTARLADGGAWLAAPSGWRHFA